MTHIWTDIRLRFAIADEFETTDFYRRNSAWMEAYIALDKPPQKEWPEDLRIESEWLGREGKRVDSLLFVRHPLFRPGVLLELQEDSGQAYCYMLGGRLEDTEWIPDLDGINPRATVLRARRVV